MAHNKLRRDIAARLAAGGVFHPLDAKDDKALLERALGALGGPVGDTRPQVETPTQGEMMGDVPAVTDEPVNVVDEHTFIIPPTEDQ